MRVPEKPACIHFFRQNPVFTTLHLKSPVHVVPPPYVVCRGDISIAVVSLIPGKIKDGKKKIGFKKLSPVSVTPPTSLYPVCDSNLVF
jgi:hypothetical protein